MGNDYKTCTLCQDAGVKIKFTSQVFLCSQNGPTITYPKSVIPADAYMCRCNFFLLMMNMPSENSGAM